MGLRATPSTVLRPRRRGPRALAAILLWGLGLAPAVTPAAPAARVHHSAERYHIQAESVVQASPEAVMSILTDYAAMGRIHPVVTGVEVIRRSGDTARVEMLMEDCILFFCIDIHQTLDYRRAGPRRLEARVDPAASDFSYGRLQWRVEETAPGTSHVRFQAQMEPSFWLPPLLGTFALEQRLKQIALETQANLGRLVRGEPPEAASRPPPHRTIFDEPNW